MSSPVVVFITADNCGHCRTLKEKLPDIEAALIGLGGVRIVKVPLPSIGSQIDTSRYPAGLNNYLKWFPMILLIPGAKWDQAMSNTKSNTDLSAFIMNGTMENGSPKHGGSSYSLDKSGIIAWVSSHLSSLPSSSGYVAPSFSSGLVYVPTSKTKTDSTCDMRLLGRRGW